MSLIIVACYDTTENGRTKYTEQTLNCILQTVNRKKHRVIIVDNGSCNATKALLKGYADIFQIITLPENIGTAKGINKGIALRNPGENVVKMDNDVFISKTGWCDDLDEAIVREPLIGIVGLKRKDCLESPDNTNPWYTSNLCFLPHLPGQSWIPFEEVQHVMGTCQMFSSKLLDRIGFLNQPGLYGFDDSLASFRARVAGFSVGFLPHIQIDHIDVNENPYWKEKERIAGVGMREFNELCAKYKSGELDVYYKDE